MEVSVELVQVSCCSGCVYAITRTLYDRMEKTKAEHEMIYCPLGHRWHYIGKTDAEKLQDCRQLLAERNTALQRAEKERDKLKALGKAKKK